MNEFIKNLKTPIAIVGMGKSGEAAKRLLLAAGVSANAIKCFDGKLATADYNDPSKLMSEVQPKTLVVSPGVPLASQWIQSARQHGIEVTSEISLSCSFLTTEKLIGVTGSVGKSTTVSLLQAGLAAFSKTAFVGGNLGTPFAEYAADLVEGVRKPADWVVLELSSYQLENCDGLFLDLSAITFLTSNHLERYENLQHYYETKWKILSITKDKMLLNSEGGDLVEYAKTMNHSEQVRFISRNDTELKSLQLDKALLIGQHNQDNLALAATLALEAGWPHSAIEAMKNFTGLSHRLENLGTSKGIRFINDSKATAIDSVLIAATAAFDTLVPGGKLFLLLGGRDKNLPWEQLKVLAAFIDIEFIFFGECREIAQKKSELDGVSFSRLDEALTYAFDHAKSADTVLLSPGGTSLDEFKSFEDRGNFFKKKVEEFSSK
ncbi:UDP-N-acetylmuramoyl-L-alanine--D-glutamate ligase [Bdellovibrio svalbardensis]|uniref:UDP-N-acetylmuramoylalanine--D-glutamate ligase n=1 Tax=Bdellovibrio svalbardensis TaxID=2972972 RepID=A0ABT6DDF2_9BACT|nr:UDP-N-acetylmuramoyl-L-alanine--D-glutamate ligase [Bdellovibrio svalbardensis]MDG0814871.1 UDP-N-acetylmuramoyl-L-alanine--D-glutamate ligase [Bdellovibrio svalbardensis]